ncbi:DUF4011 domain-containing protein [Stieleria sp. JC731]|uniref:DUF4011 domain-containing protein n=1 Tax=Pirellulaceae TaxID=2691357 RepID=UPI001E5FDBF4|nr:DUF4011 domain-containing protein [Stieleria sp. JC731]MCC9600027.1 DUF4011 domain-containing protein [Stieleria sp. JC731]
MELEAVIEKTRRDLLELTARNRLIHTPLEGKRKSWLQIDDERSDQLFDLLVRQGKTMSFLSANAVADSASATDTEDDDRERDEFLRQFDSADESPLPNRADDDRPGDVDLQGDESVDEGAVHERHTDRFLQTQVAADSLDDRLLKIYYEARSAEEEQGVSILYLACGFLLWRESKTSDVNRYAPLLLLPVEMSRHSAQTKFRLKFRDADVVTNLSIQARLRQDFDLQLPDLPEDVSEEPDWTPKQYFDEVRQCIDGREGWQVLDNEILLWFFSFTKFLMFRDLSPSSWPEEASLADNDLIAGLLGQGFSPGSALPPLCGDDEPIDEMINPADVVHVTDADSSQAVVIEEIIRGRNLVVQGPPGTGKSQTITNAIAAAVHAGKRVLFVAEKMAALDVVKRRLDAVGLGPMTLELHSHKARKREIIEDLKNTLELGAPAALPSSIANELRQSSHRLRQHDHVLHTPVGTSGRSPYQVMGRWLTLQQRGRTVPAYRLNRLCDWSPEDFGEFLHLAKELDQLLEASGTPQANPWHGVCCTPMTPANVDRLLTSLSPIADKIEKLRQANSELAGLLGLPPASNLAQTVDVAKLARHVMRFPKFGDRNAIDNHAWENGIDQIQSQLSAVQQLQQARQELGETVNDIAFTVDWSAARIAIAAHGKSWLRIFNGQYRNAIATLRGVLAAPLPKDADARVTLIDSIIAIQKSSRQVESIDAAARAMLGSLWAGEATDVQKCEAIVAWVNEGQQTKLTQQHARRLVAAISEPNALQGPLAQIQSLLKEIDESLRSLSATLKIDFQRAFRCSDSRTTDLAAWTDRLTAWQDAGAQLSHYLATMARINKFRDAELAAFADDIELGNFVSGTVADQLELVRCDAIIAKAWQERPDLANFHGDTYEKLRDRFANLDLARIEASRVDVARKHHDQLPARSADGGQVGVVMHEANKKRRHIPLRRLIREAGRAIQKIKPVFMMSPLSVAQYLEPGAVEFDLLVIDEASQVQPVDALGAIARSKQIVVVGDQKQLPPTDFFGRMGDERVDDDDDGVSSASDLESILGLCEARGLPSRMLRWHYRSRHESLIAVSNRQFYDDRLYIVPSPISEGGDLGLRFRYVSDGCYDRGGSRTNRIEAQAVADAVLQHARETPHLSLGVATFSAAQRDAVRDEIERRRKEDDSVEEFFSAGGVEPFFVKSLENVQGDQRDVIFISIGYARDKDNYFAHSFGPLNRKGGERRLNVLISRAASACHVFASIKSDDIDLSRTQSEGIAALKMFLHYAEHGRLDAARSHGDADSLFEEQVAKALRNRGLEVDHQIGVGGFFIDLAIRDPQRGGRYLMGIECDGAQYHSARWVRDRDRIRQQVLEARGWHIHRIWSTDWFQRPDEQIEKTIEALGLAQQHWKKIDEGEHLAEAARQEQRDANQKSPVAIERHEPVDAEDSYESLRIDYVETTAEPTDSGTGPNDLKDSPFEAMVSRVILAESPIHIDEIGRRMIALCGQGRLTNALKSRLAETIQQMQNAGSVIQRGDFVYHTDQKVFPVRYRKELENAKLRNTDFISPEELRNAIVIVVENQIGTDMAETFTSVAKLFGISNGKTLQTNIEAQIDHLLSQAALEDRAGNLFVAPRTSRAC